MQMSLICELGKTTWDETKKEMLCSRFCDQSIGYLSVEFNKRIKRLLRMCPSQPICQRPAI